MEIKESYLDTKICCPATRQEVYCRFIPIELYSYYFNNGYSCIFEVEPIQHIEKSKKDKK